jgi:hypothetical protein
MDHVTPATRDRRKAWPVLASAKDRLRLRPGGKRLIWAGGLIAGGALAGALVATALPATADPSASPSAASSAAPGGPGGPRGPEGRRGPGGQRSDETPLTGTDAEKAKAAALKAVPGATIDRVETDADGAVYEAHVTKSDGSKVTVKFDKDFNVTAVQDGMGSHK